jgi:hypothetical protein
VKRTLAGGVVAIFLVAVHAPIHALIEQPTDIDIANALGIARGSEIVRTRFHASYIIPVKDPLVESLEVITEFRRYVLAAEEQTQAGNWMMARGGFDQKGRTLTDLLKPLAGQVSIRTKLRFHPLNSYVAVPPLDILLGEPTLVAQQTLRTPLVTPAAGDNKKREMKTRDFIYGATIETTFDAREIADRVLAVRLVFEGEEILRGSVDFSRLD